MGEGSFIPFPHAWQLLGRTQAVDFVLFCSHKQNRQVSSIHVILKLNKLNSNPVINTLKPTELS